MTVRDSRRRTAIDAAGRKIPFNLRRLYCETCNRLHLEIPDCIVPHKHYLAYVISKTVDGSIDYAAVDDRTIARWRKHT